MACGRFSEEFDLELLFQPDFSGLLTFEEVQANLTRTCKLFRAHRRDFAMCHEQFCLYLSPDDKKIWMGFKGYIDPKKLFLKLKPYLKVTKDTKDTKDIKSQTISVEGLILLSNGPMLAARRLLVKHIIQCLTAINLYCAITHEQAERLTNILRISLPLSRISNNKSIDEFENENPIINPELLESITALNNIMDELRRALPERAKQIEKGIDKGDKELKVLIALGSLEFETEIKALENFKKFFFNVNFIKSSFWDDDFYLDLIVFADKCRANYLCDIILQNAEVFMRIHSHILRNESNYTPSLVETIKLIQQERKIITQLDNNNQMRREMQGIRPHTPIELARYRKGRKFLGASKLSNVFAILSVILGIITCAICPIFAVGLITFCPLFAVNLARAKYYHYKFSKLYPLDKSDKEANIQLMDFTVKRLTLDPDMKSRMPFINKNTADLLFKGCKLLFQHRDERLNQKMLAELNDYCRLNPNDENVKEHLKFFGKFYNAMPSVFPTSYHRLRNRLELTSEAKIWVAKLPPEHESSEKKSAVAPAVTTTSLSSTLPTAASSSFVVRAA